MTPELVVTNARIATGDARRPWATALAVQNGTLARVGAAAEILKLAGPTTSIVDAHGQALTLPPGSTVGTPIQVTIPEHPDAPITIAPVS
jgi:predicted amidohydrolase YtcJ